MTEEQIIAVGSRVTINTAIDPMELGDWDGTFDKYMYAGEARYIDGVFHAKSGTVVAFIDDGSLQQYKVKNANGESAWVYDRMLTVVEETV